MTAAGPQQLVLVDSNLGQGLFTYHLVRGLSGAAASPDGVVRLQGLHNYVAEAVERGSSGKMRPTLFNAIPLDWPVALSASLPR